VTLPFFSSQLISTDMAGISAVPKGFLKVRVYKILYIVHSSNYALLINFEKFKIYIKRHINIVPTCFGLRPSSGSLYRAWLKLYFCQNTQ